jgi:hypothetical protein
MKRRGIVIPAFKEVMTPTKKEEITETSAENNESVVDLFNAPSSNDSSAPQSDNTGNQEPTDQNGSLAF